MPKNSSEYKNLKSKINFLSKFSDLELIAIPENKDINIAYTEILEYLLDPKFHTNKRKYIKKIVSKLYHPTEIIPNTIGSFIFGCNQSDYGDVDKYCSILCLNSWNHSKKIKCNYNVVLQINNNSEDRFIFKNITNSEKCFVYVSDDFIGFYQYEIDKLAAKKIKSIQILSTRNSKHFKTTEFLPLSSAPKISIVKNIDEEEKEIINQSWMILIICVIFILFIILLFLFHFFN